jgi:uncharacterized membrane protein YedE/YeeE
MMQYFPNGIYEYIIGGVLLGVAVSFIYLTTSKIAGASTFLESFLSYFFKNKFFDKHKGSRSWRNIFTLGIISGGIIYALFIRELWQTNVSILNLFIGGILVGYGTRKGKGCTSGHGICGLSSFSIASLINVIIFIGVAMIVANITKLVGILQ